MKTAVIIALVAALCLVDPAEASKMKHAKHRSRTYYRSYPTVYYTPQYVPVRYYVAAPTYYVAPAPVYVAPAPYAAPYPAYKEHSYSQKDSYHA